VQGIGYIAKLNHFRHATSILSCRTHVNVMLFKELTFLGELLD